MSAIKARLEGKKTYIGIIIGAGYAVMIHLGLAESNEMVWTGIAAWTGVAFRQALK